MLAEQSPLRQHADLHAQRCRVTRVARPMLRRLLIEEGEIMFSERPDSSSS